MKQTSCFKVCKTIYIDTFQIENVILLLLSNIESIKTLILLHKLVQLSILIREFVSTMHHVTIISYARFQLQWRDI